MNLRERKNQHFNFDNLTDMIHLIPEEYKNKKISILMPFYNESGVIAENLKKVAETLKLWNWNFEIVASDDGSSDNSFDSAEKCQEEIPELIVVRSYRNYGKGRALLTAFEASSGEYVLFLDSDLELSVNHIPYFFQKMITSDADVVIGSKIHSDSDCSYPWIRKIYSMCYFMLVKILFGLPLKDTQTGIKLFKRNVLDHIFPYLIIKKFAFDIELLVLCHFYKYRIEQHPIVLKFSRGTAVTRMSLDTILWMFKDTLAIFWRLKSGFWKGLSTVDPNVKKMTYAVIALSRNVKAYCGDVFYLDRFADFPLLISQIAEYDTIIFLEDNSELPVFSEDSLNKVFSDKSVNIVYPLVYSDNEKNWGYLRYSLFTNMFFNVGYYPHYRPVRAHVLPMRGDFQISTGALVFRNEFLQKTYKKYGYLPHFFDTNNQIYYSPYFFLHKNFSVDDNLWNEYYLSQKQIPLCGIKRICLSVYLMFVLLFVAGFVFRCYVLMWFLVGLELIIYLWSIFSLGIRLGIPYLVLFDKYRFQNILSWFKR
ncbi:MAG: glycosyltransferase family 2 protein [Brevinemataceae bacterium]